MLAVEALKPFTGGESKKIFSTPIQPVNDTSAEYVISMRKHFVPNKYCIVQFGVRNTLEDQILSEVTLKIKGFEAQGA